jgi:TPR repeat protein
MKSGKKILFLALLLVAFPMALNAGELEDGVKAFHAEDYQTAYKLLYPLAEQGEASAQDCIGAMYCEGLGVEKDETTAAGWYEKAADQGYAKAQNAIGAMYVNGVGVEEDRQKGLSYITKAAVQGLEVAQQNAYALYYAEAQEGNIPALHNVAYMCLNGWGGEAEPQSCMKLLEVAATNGYSKSAKALATIYKKGKYGVEIDEEKAALWSNFAENPPEVPAAN